MAAPAIGIIEVEPGNAPLDPPGPADDAAVLDDEVVEPALDVVIGDDSRRAVAAGNEIEPVGTIAGGANVADLGNGER